MSNTIPSSNQRKDTIESVASSNFDLIVIGGGITGAGILLDAQSRGLKTCLIEMQDFAEGTSSRSTKLIHGGLRYLKQREFKLVKEVGRERTIVEKNAPHLTYITPVLVPLYKGGSIGKLAARIGMKIYDWLAKVKKEDRHKILSKSETQKIEPLLSAGGLKGAILYPEYRTNDARLTIEIIKKSKEYGAKAINHSKVNDLLYDNQGKVNGVKFTDIFSGAEHSISSKVVVNSTGPWVDHVCRLDKSKEKKLILTKGVHVVVDKEKLPIKYACYYDTSDGRMVFAIPSNDKTYIGTTDTIYQGNLSIPNVTYDDSKYLIDSLNSMFQLSLDVTDIESSWSGLRPLIKQKNSKNPSEISRKDEMFHSESDLISIAGGKLTGYRKMAEKAVDAVVTLLKSQGDLEFKKCHTQEIKVSGGETGIDNVFSKLIDQAKSMNIEEGDLKRLISLYGTNAEKVLKYIEEEAKSQNNYALELGMLMYSVNHEFALTPSDFLIRRAPFLYFQLDRLVEIQEAIINRMSDHFKWSSAEKAKKQNKLETEILSSTQNFKIQNPQ